MKCQNCESGDFGDCPRCFSCTGLGCEHGKVCAECIGDFRSGHQLETCGSCCDQAAVHHRGYCIYLTDAPFAFRWQWASENYDGPGDPRCGSERSVGLAILAVDEYLDDAIEREWRDKRAACA